MTERCRKCGLSADDVLRPENFYLTDDGLCPICAMEEYQFWPDYRGIEQRYIDELGE